VASYLRTGSAWFFIPIIPISRNYKPGLKFVKQQELFALREAENFTNEISGLLKSSRKVKFSAFARQVFCYNIAWQQDKKLHISRKLGTGSAL